VDGGEQAAEADEVVHVVHVVGIPVVLATRAEIGVFHSYLLELFLGLQGTDLPA